MIGLQRIRDDAEGVKRAIARKGGGAEPIDAVDRILAADARRRALEAEVNDLRSRRNAGNRELGTLMRDGRRDEGEQLKARMAELSARIDALGAELTAAEEGIEADLLLVPNLAAFAFAVAGVGPPPGVLVALSVPFAVAGFFLPDFTLRDQAERRRRGFRHALSAYLDLVNILLAGGAGIETALWAAADAGDGWGFQRIRAALHRSRLTGRSPWETFAALGRDLDVSELSELASSISLAGSHGARIRASLAAKADTLRGHQVAETEAAAEAATERMTIPLAVLLFGFLLFIAYPAIQQITSASSGGLQP